MSTYRGRGKGAKQRMIKKMFTFNYVTTQSLKHEADSRGISVQELIRAVIVPDWLKENKRA